MENISSWGASDIEDEEEAEMRKGPWTVEEDMQLAGYIRLHGEGRWSFLARAAGLKRTGRSCRLRWLNSLRPDLKRSKITPEEEHLIIELHGRWGNRWSRIARSLPGRTDNDIKNYWRTRIKGKMNLQAECSSTGVDAENQLHFERLGSSYLSTSSQSPHDPENTEPSTRFPTQNTEEAEVQKIKNPYLQKEISPEVIPIREEIDESELHGEIHGPQDRDYGQPVSAWHEHLEGSANHLFENMLAYNFSVDSVGSLLYSSEFCAAGATQDGTISSPPYMVASPEAFSDSEAYYNRYSDVLWNMDEEDDRCIGSKPSAFLNGRRSY